MFARILQEQHQDLLYSNEDIELLIYILNTYVLNNSLEDQVIEKMVKNLQQNLTESDLVAMGESRVANLARSLKQIVLQRGKTEFKEFEQMASNVYLKKYKYRIERNAEKEAAAEDTD